MSKNKGNENKYLEQDITFAVADMLQTVRNILDIKSTIFNMNNTVAQQRIALINEKISRYQITVIDAYNKLPEHQKNKSLKDVITESNQFIDECLALDDFSKKSLFKFNRFAVLEGVLKNFDNIFKNNNPETRAKIANELSELDMTGAKPELIAARDKAINSLNGKGQIRLIELLNNDRDKFVESIKFATKFGKLEHNNNLADILEDYLLKHANPKTMENIQYVCDKLLSPKAEIEAPLKAFCNFIAAIQNSLGLGQDVRITNELKKAIMSTSNEIISVDFYKDKANDQNKDTIKSFVDKLARNETAAIKR